MVSNVTRITSPGQQPAALSPRRNLLESKCYWAQSILRCRCSDADKNWPPPAVLFVLWTAASRMNSCGVWYPPLCKEVSWWRLLGDRYSSKYLSSWGCSYGNCSHYEYWARECVCFQASCGRSSWPPPQFPWSVRTWTSHWKRCALRH